MLKINCYTRGKFVRAGNYHAIVTAQPEVDRPSFGPDIKETGPMEISTGENAPGCKHGSGGRLDSINAREFDDAMRSRDQRKRPGCDSDRSGECLIR